MTRRIALLAAVALSLWASACAQEPLTGEADPEGARIEIAVAPFVIFGTSNVHYRLTVTNGDDVTVWSREVFSDQFGPGGGALSYVGPCDATTPINHVTVEVLELFTGDNGDESIDMELYKLPGPMTRDFECVANKDTFVEFDITILIDPPPKKGEGNVIIALGFTDLFCSAKVDCSNPLLFNAEGVRDTTAVVALACTAGVGADTVLYHNNVTIDCDVNGTVAVDPAAGPGNLAVGAGITGDPGIIFGAAVQQGDEQLGYNKRYWNVLLGLEEGVPNCRLTAQATATDGPLTNNTMPAGMTYPYVDFNVTLTDANGTLVCGQHPINGEGVRAGVSAQYTDPNTSTFWSYLFHGGTIGIVGALTEASPGHWADGSYAASCLEYRHPTGGKAYSGATGSGVYAIDPADTPDLGPFEVYCDMETDGGGWTLFSQAVPVVDAAQSLCVSSIVGTLDLDDTTVSAPAKLPDTTIDAIWQTGTERKLLIKSDLDVSEVTFSGTAAFERTCILDFVSGHAWSALPADVPAVSDLDSVVVDCTPALGDNIIDATWTGTWGCGFAYELVQSPSRFVMYSTTTAYPAPNAACSASVNAGRSWLSPGNYGCNATKTFLR